MQKLEEIFSDGDYIAVTESDIKLFENRIGFALPLSYKKFILGFNGRDPQRLKYIVKLREERTAYVESMFAIHGNGWKNLERQYQEVDIIHRSELLRIATTGGDGNFYLELCTEEVIYKNDFSEDSSDSFKDFHSFLEAITKEIPQNLEDKIYEAVEADDVDLLISAIVDLARVTSTLPGSGKTIVEIAAISKASKVLEFALETLSIPIGRSLEYIEKNERLSGADYSIIRDVIQSVHS